MLKGFYYYLSRIDMNGVIKVTDFGLTEYMRSSNYFRKVHTDSSRDEKMPIRWMAPESIDCDLYTEKTDIVSLCMHPI